VQSNTEIKQKELAAHEPLVNCFAQNSFAFNYFVLLKPENHKISDTIGKAS